MVREWKGQLAAWRKVRQIFVHKKRRIENLSLRKGMRRKVDSAVIRPKDQRNGLNENKTRRRQRLLI